jgi:hypothetical protein
MVVNSGLTVLVFEEQNIYNALSQKLCYFLANIEASVQREKRSIFEFGLNKKVANFSCTYEELGSFKEDTCLIYFVEGQGLAKYGQMVAGEIRDLTYLINQGNKTRK